MKVDLIQDKSSEEIEKVSHSWGLCLEKVAAHCRFGWSITRRRTVSVQSCPWVRNFFLPMRSILYPVHVQSSDYLQLYAKATHSPMVGGSSFRGSSSGSSFFHSSLSTLYHERKAMRCGSLNSVVIGFTSRHLSTIRCAMHTPPEHF